MKNYYSTIDNIVLTFSSIEERNGIGPTGRQSLQDGISILECKNELAVI